MIWKIYLSGEIHTAWRDEIIQKSKNEKLPVSFLTPELNHEQSDAAGDFLAEASSNFWRDNQSAKVNSIRIKNKTISIIYSKKYFTAIRYFQILSVGNCIDNDSINRVNC